MGGIRIQGAFVLGALLVALVCTAGCLSTNSVDLATNSHIYVSPGYKAPSRTQAPVFVQRIRDRRKPPDLSDRASVKKQFPDNVWERPIPVMLEDVLLDEIDRSGIYKSISSGSAGVPGSRDFVVEPTLHALYRYREAMVDGTHFGKRRSGAYAALHLRVMSPIDAKGKREILLDKVFQDLVLSSLGRGRPQQGVVLAGRAVQNIMRQVMPALYESNIRAIPGAPAKK